MSIILCNCPFKNGYAMFMMLLSLLSLLLNVEAQESVATTNSRPELPQPVEPPSKGVVITVLSIMFAAAFLFLAYVKFCRISPHNFSSPNADFQNFHEQTRSGSRFSGLDRQVIEKLPFFKFSSLKGSKEGLECTVCLSKFEDAEFLRLLPKCKHAFHKNCIDQWLENHSNCPLCRRRIEPGDIKTLTCSISSRFLRVPSNLTEANLEIFVQRAPSSRGSSRFNIKSEQLLIDQQDNSNSRATNGKPWHKLNHKIVISDVVTRSRWSDLSSSDLLSLNCEMLNDMSSTRFNSGKLYGISSLPSSSNEEENSLTALNNPGEKRSMSEIVDVARFADITKHNRIRDSNNGKEERLWRTWLPIARRTVQLFARQERIPMELKH